MVDRKPTAQARKRFAKVLQDDYWDCSVCTLRNSPEDFKCSACDVRKGTSTRKPRLNQQIVDQQEATRLVTLSQMPTAPSVPAAVTHASKKVKEESTVNPDKHMQLSKQKKIKRGRCHIPGINRTSANEYSITVDDKTIVFMEFQAKVVDSPH